MRKNGYVLEADLTGKTIIVTGSNCGIGRVTAIKLAVQGANVILACRSEEKTKVVVEEIRNKTGRPESATFMQVDFASLESVRAFAQKYLESELPLHVLINNAGFAGTSQKITVDGFEPHFQVNYLSQVLLTTLLLPKLKASAPSRIVNVSSWASGMLTGLRWDKWQNYAASGSMEALWLYGESKFMQIAYTIRLAEELQGTGVNVYAVHPGAVTTNAYREYSNTARWIISLFFLTDEVGATATLYAATSPELENVSGVFYDQCVESVPNSRLKDKALLEEVWTKSKAFLHLE